MKNNQTSVHLSMYKQVIELRKKGKLVADIATMLKMPKGEVQKIILHFDNLTKPNNSNHD